MKTGRAMAILAGVALLTTNATALAQIYNYGEVHAPIAPGCTAPKSWTKTGTYYTCQSPPTPPYVPQNPPPTDPLSVCAAAVAARGYVLRSSPWVISAHPRDVTYWQGIADNSAATAMGTYFDVGCQILDSSGGVTGLQIFAHCVSGCGSDGGG